MLYRSIRPLLFCLDPERAHRLTLGALNLVGHIPGSPSTGSPVEVMGIRFPNRLGLAAGFDKSADAIDGLGRLGFGFIEVGTVTLRPQLGQLRPRVFRFPQADALINRMGFPNDGASAVAQRLTRKRYRGTIGVNIGKNADTPLANAIDDYVGCMRELHTVADYLVVNISSPNTPRLRDLNATERLEPLLTGLLGERDRLARAGHHRPVLLKVSPDLDTDALTQLATVVTRVGLDGLVATNTTTQRCPVGDYRFVADGGLSGRPLHGASVQTVATLRRLLHPGFPIIGVGGVDSAPKAIAMREAGADLVQIYTGLVFRGPALVTECLHAL